MVKSLDRAEEQAEINQNEMEKLKPIVEKLAEKSVPENEKAELVKTLRNELIRKDQEIAELEKELENKQRSIDKLKGIEAEKEKYELDLYRSQNRVKRLIDSNHDLSNQVENINSSYENLLCKNDELKAKISRLRNELELLNIPYQKRIKAENRRMSGFGLVFCINFLELRNFNHPIQSNQIINFEFFPSKIL